MNRILSTIAVILVAVIAASGCATGRISGPNYNPPVAKLPAEVSALLNNKEVSISAPSGALGVIEDAVLQADGKPLLRVGRGEAEIKIKAVVQQESSSGYHGYYSSPVPLVPSGPAYRMKAEVWVYENGILRYRGVGASSYFDPGQISRNLAIEAATRYALANLRGGR